MGVRGLTTYIANRSDVYLKKHELSNTHLVIDGNSTCSQIYRLHSKLNDCFGGDYDKYAHSIYKFFHALEICNITPIVIFDGGYEKRKLKTVMDRMKTKLKSSYNLNSVTEGSCSLFPLFLRELFKDIVLRLNIKCFRSEFEADSAIAWIAKALDCPVLSYDSDFFIFDALYVPFPTLDINPSKRYNKQSKEFTYYLQCSLYRIEYFLDSFGGMDKSKLPLLASLLGNDYMNRREFGAFYGQLKLEKGGHSSSEQQRRIKTVIKWLKNETFESAVSKILSRFKSYRRKNLKLRLEQALQAYMYVDSEILQFLEIDSQAVEKICSTQLDNIKLVIDDDINIEESKHDLPEIADDVSGDDQNSVFSSTTEMSYTNDTEDEVCIEEEVSVDMCNSKHKAGCSRLQAKETVTIPEMFKTKFKKCIYSPSFMDILTLNCYYFIPQVEDHSKTSSHAISLPLLSVIHRILRGPSSRFLLYYSRNDHCDVKKFYLETHKDQLPNLSELEEMTNDETRMLFMKILSIDDTFIEKYVKCFPEKWHLLLISLNYWVRNAEVDFPSIYAIILCAVILMYVDEQIGFCRSSRSFASKYNVKLAELSKELAKNTSENSSLTINDAIKQITYNDSLFCMKSAIPYFQMDLKTRGNVKLYDRSLIHDIAELQSILLHVKYLNSLLNFPFADFCISDFYDGTFIYNMIVNLKKRSNPEAYLKSFLCDSPSVLNVFELVIKNVVESHTDNDIVNSKNLRRRRSRRKRKSRSVAIETNDDCPKSSSNEDNIFDENNRFTLLSMS